MCVPLVINFFFPEEPICVRQNAYSYCLCRFSFPLVLRCPAGIDRGCMSCQTLASILDCDTLNFDVMLISIWYQTWWIELLYCAFQKYAIDHVFNRWSAKKKKRANTSYKATKQTERTFYLWLLLFLKNFEAGLDRNFKNIVKSKCICAQGRRVTKVHLMCGGTKCPFIPNGNLLSLLNNLLYRTTELCLSSRFVKG